MKTMSLSAAQPERPTISSTIAERSVVRWAGPASPRVVQSSGIQATDELVVCRHDMLNLVNEKVAASSVSSPRIVSETAPVLTSSAWNWM